VGNDGQFARLMEVLDDAAAATDPRFATNSARVANREDLKALIERHLSTGGADHWQERITAAGVPCGPINDIAQGLDLADRLGLDPIVEIDDPRRATPSRQVANPVSYSRTPASYRSAPPDVDEDRAAVLALLAERA
jgi:crotonobetainyl-CoA:carnitine CoA-transferase CaiB-like acyl-CoA transferase